VINAYGKVVHAMAHANPPQADQTNERHGEEAKAGTAVHKFPISAQVPTTNNKDKHSNRIYREEPGTSRKHAGVWHLLWEHSSTLRRRWRCLSSL
jgi:hypothetical protein